MDFNFGLPVGWFLSSWLGLLIVLDPWTSGRGSAQTFVGLIIVVVAAVAID